jgi:membrane protein DedA with SNARE-associated domain
MEWALLLAADDSSTRERLVHLVADYSYVGVFMFLIACGLGFPCPEEVSLIGGGFAVYQAHPGPAGWPWVALMVSVAMTGVLVGDAMLWAIGRRVGDHPERVPFIGRHLTPQRMKNARAMFERHGAKAVFFGRFLFGVRAVTFFVSGSMRVPIVTFLIMDGLAALISVPISIILAWHFGSSLETVFSKIQEIDQVIWVVVLGVAAIVGFLGWRRRHALRSLDAEDAPVAPAAPAPPPAEAVGTTAREQDPTRPA